MVCYCCTLRSSSLPAHKLSDSIKATTQLPIRLNHLPLQNRISHNVLAILWPYTSKPNTLRCLSCSWNESSS